jgi:hypothetical protein
VKPDAVIESSVFQLRTINDDSDEDSVYPTPILNGPIQHYHMGFHNIVQPVLKFDYMLPENCSWGKLTSSYGKLSHRLVERLEQALMLELFKIPVAQRPIQYQQLVDGEIGACEAKGQFDLPKYWTFYDKEILALLVEGSAHWIKNED